MIVLIFSYNFSGYQTAQVQFLNTTGMTSVHKSVLNIRSTCCM